MFTGHMSRAGCVCLVHMANIIVLTSHSESFPNVLVEGQAMGLAAVTFDVGAAEKLFWMVLPVMSYSLEIGRNTFVD